MNSHSAWPECQVREKHFSGTGKGDCSNEFCQIPLRDLTDGDLRRFIKETILKYELTRKAYSQLRILLRGTLIYAMGHTDISVTKSIYYFNRDKEADKRMAISNAIIF